LLGKSTINGRRQTEEGSWQEQVYTENRDLPMGRGFRSSPGAFEVTGADGLQHLDRDWLRAHALESAGPTVFVRATAHEQVELARQV
jgi:hypothetical protein